MLFALKLELLNADFTRERADELIALAKHLEEYNATAIKLLQRCLEVSEDSDETLRRLIEH